MTKLEFLEIDSNESFFQSILKQIDRQRTISRELAIVKTASLCFITEDPALLRPPPRKLSCDFRNLIKQ